MPSSPDKTTYCTDHRWQGRADCVHCGIRHLMLFSGIPDSGFAHLLKPIDNHVYDAGATIYEEGTRSQTVFSIRRGMVKLLNRTPDGNQRIVRLLGKGVTIGLELLDHGAGYHHTAVAVQDLDLCSIPLATLRDLEARFPALCDKVRQQVQHQVDRADHWIIALNTGVTRARIAQLLLLLMEIGAVSGSQASTRRSRASPAEPVSSSASSTSTRCTKSRPLTASASRRQCVADCTSSTRQCASCRI